MAKGPEDRDPRDLSEAEADLWRRVTADVKRLERKGRTAPEPRSPDAPQRTTAKTNKAPRPRAAGAASAVVSPPAPPLPELDHGAAPGLDKRTFERLRRGRIAIDSRLDLHGFTQQEAHRALHDFLTSSQAAGRRCVLVITGKGSRGDGETGVLRTAVPAWLNRPPNRDRVLAFCYATPAHGGEGALFVLLRRHR